MSRGLGVRLGGVDPKVVAALTAVVALPMVVALLALRDPTWFPLFDLTMTELKVRDVGSSDPPLVGLAGRIGAADQPGSHPGPVAYWLLWPVYRLLGRSAWALQVSSVVFHVVAIAVALWIAGRRGGARLTVGLAAMLAVVVAAFGPVLFTVPWNPNLPVLWWLVFLLALWSVVAGDLPLVPVAVIAGSIIAQTHVPYLALTSALTGAAVVASLVSLASRRSEGSAGPPTRGAVRRGVSWLLAGAAVGIVLWLPPLVDQLTNDPGNARILVDHFRAPTSDPIGLAEGARVVVERLDPVALLTLDTPVEGFTPSSTLVPGVALLALWSLSVVMSWRRHQTMLRWLHLTVGTAVVVGVVAASRIFGGVWNYLLLWAWIVCSLMIVATVWGLSTAAIDRVPDRHRSAALRGATVALLVGTVAWTAIGVVEATDAEVSGQMRSTQTGEVAAQTAEALAARKATDRFLVAWRDPTHLGTQGWGLILELERRGFDVAGSPPLASMLGRHRVVEPHEADGVLLLAVGPAIDDLRADASAVEVAYTDHDSQAAARERLIDQVVATLVAEGEDELADAARQQPAAARSDPRMPPELARSLAEAAEIGYPVAVFLMDGSATG